MAKATIRIHSIDSHTKAATGDQVEDSASDKASKKVSPRLDFSKHFLEWHQARSRIRAHGNQWSSFNPRFDSPPRAIAYLNMGGLGCHDLGVLDKVVFLTYHTAIPKTVRPWHPILNKAIALILILATLTR